MYAKGSVAKNEQSVYHFKDNKAAPTEPSKLEKNRSGAAGKANPIKPTGGKAVVGKPKTSMDRQ